MRPCENWEPNCIRNLARSDSARTGVNPAAISTLFARPSSRRFDVVLVNLKRCQAGAHLFGTGRLWWAQNDGGAVSADVEIVHTGETLDYLFGRGDLIFGGFFSQQSKASRKQANHIVLGVFGRCGRT